MKPIVFVIMLFSLASCIDGNVSSNQNFSGTTVQVSTADYNSLNIEQQYQLTNKLLATLYKGKPVSDFFELKEGLSTPVKKQAKNDIDAIRNQLSKNESYYDSFLGLINQRYFYDDRRKKNTRAYPMTVLYEMPLSKQYYNRWMAYILANTILFSPAYELESVDFTDVESVYNNLVFMLDNNKSIAEITYAHVISEENWRRFRSPEDNTREMMEIFLHQFKDDEVPKASTACKNWYLSNGSEGYQLRKGLNANNQPQLSLLGRNDIVSCLDFYRALSQHPNLIPNIASVLVNQFFYNAPLAQRQQLVSQLLSTNPRTFKQLFDGIIFSKEYLFDSSRTKSYEETVLGTGAKINWYAGRDFFYNLNDDRAGDTPVDLSEIKQNPFSYKLGRKASPPLDSLSFAYYHKSVREQLLMDRRTTSDPSNTTDNGWQTFFINNSDVDRLSDQDFIHYLFLSVLSRKATGEELAALEKVFNDNNIGINRLKRTNIVLDYISRLSEMYFYKKIL